jgi:hypothetical protein
LVTYFIQDCFGVFNTWNRALEISYLKKEKNKFYEIFFCWLVLCRSLRYFVEQMLCHHLILVAMQTLFVCSQIEKQILLHKLFYFSKWTIKTCSRHSRRYLGSHYLKKFQILQDIVSRLSNQSITNQYLEYTNHTDKLTLPYISIKI